MEQWINLKVADMKDKIKSNRKRYFILSGILMVLNLITLVVASIAIDSLRRHTGYSTAMLLSIFSAIAIIASFLTNALVIFWKGIMKDKDYKDAMDELQHQKMLYEHSASKYTGKNKDKLLNDEAKSIYEEVTSKKIKKKKVSLFVRMFTGGNDV